MDEEVPLRKNPPPKINGQIFWHVATSATNRTHRKSESVTYLPPAIESYSCLTGVSAPPHQKTGFHVISITV